MYWKSILRPILLAAALVAALPSWAETPKFKVGVIIPLTGPLAEYGAAVRNGFEIAKQENPEVSKYLDLVYEDDQYKPKLTLSAFNKLRTVDKVNAIYVWGSEPCLALSSVAEKQEFPIFAACQHPDAAKGKEYTIRFINSGYQYSAVLLKHLRKFNIKEFAYLGAELSFFNMLFYGLKQNLKDEKIIYSETVLPNDFDFRSIIGKLKRQKITTAALFLMPAQLKEFFEQAKELDADFKIFGATPFDSTGVFGNSIGLMDGVFFVHNYADPKFRKRYKENFGNDMHIAYSANAYDFSLITAGLVKQNLDSLEANPPSSTAILNWYENTPPGEGVGGSYKFGTDLSNGKNFTFDIVIREIRSGEVHDLYISE